MKKKLIIVGGANGVGKTTFAYQYRNEYGIDYLGADDIAKELKLESSENIEIDAGKEFFRRLESYLVKKQSLIVESTLSGIGLSRQVKKFKAENYTVHIIYVFLENVRLCKNRVKIRVKKGGHNVTAEDIERRFSRSINNFKTVYMPLANTWQMFFNGLKRPVEVAMGEHGQITIIDENYYKIFMELAK